jgi:tetratricopeptide (TPR) repeat protein
MSCGKKVSSSEENTIFKFDVLIQTYEFNDLFHHGVILLNNKGDTVCVNNKILPVTLTDDSYFTINKQKNKFTIMVELGEAHPEGYDYFVFKREENKISDFVIDTIVFSRRDYNLGDDDYMFFERKQCFSSEQFNPVTFCDFKVYETDERGLNYYCDLSYLGIKMVSFSEADNNFYQLCSKDKSEIVSYFTMEKIIKSLDIVPLSTKSLDCYNNIAYYLEQSGHYDESIYLLEKIVNNYPDRIVAYLNIGDSYWDKKQIDNAKKNYQKYIHLMELQKKDMKRIPQRVYDRIK